MGNLMRVRDEQPGTLLFGVEWDAYKAQQESLKTIVLESSPE
jgi:hypothetical protein